MAEGLHHQTADGIDLVVAEMGAEGFVEVFDRGQCAHGVHVAAELADIQIVFVVVFVFDLADDQFQNVFDGDQSRTRRRIRQ